MESYRVEWSVAEETGELTNRFATKEYGDNKAGAMAFARQKSGTVLNPGTTAYVVKQRDGLDVGQWCYSSGLTFGFEN